MILRRTLPLALAASVWFAQPAAAEVGDAARRLFEAVQENVIRGYYATAREATKQEIKRLTVQSKRRSEATVEESGDATYDESLGKGAAKLRQQALRRRGSGFIEGIPATFMPPPGQCRVWLPDTQPGRQPKPSSCERALNGLPAGARVLYGGPEGEEDELPKGLGELLPADLLAALGSLWQDAELLLVDDDIYLIDDSKRTILDVLESVLLPAPE